MSCYEKILKELDLISEEQVAGIKVKEACLGLFKICKDYYLLDCMSVELNSEKKVLANYLNEGEHLSKEVFDKKKKESLPLITKLYVEGVWKLYKEKYEEMYLNKTERKFLNNYVYGENADITDLINDKKLRAKIYEHSEEILEYLDEIAERFEDSLLELQEWVDADITFRIKKLNMENLHRVMSKIKCCFLLNETTEEEGVNTLLTEKTLNYLLAYLKEKDYGACTFFIAAIRRALTTGKINSFTPCNDNKTVYFKEKFEYNFSELRKYFKALKILLDEYEDHIAFRDRIYWI